MEGLYAVGSRRVDAERAFRTRFCLERRRPDCAIFDSMAIGICYLQYGGVWRSENWKKTCVILEVSWVAFWYYHELFGFKVCMARFGASCFGQN